MSDDNLKNGQNPEVSFEPEDIEARPIIIGLIGLGLSCIAFYFVVLWMYGFLNRYQATHQAPISPLATVEKDTHHVTKAEVENFPEPRLEENERDQLDGVRIHEEERLNSYGWVDQSAGTVHIPIERAMELMVEQGVPTAPTAEPATAKSGNQKRAAATHQPKGHLLAAKH